MPRKPTSPIQNRSRFEAGDVYRNTVNSLGIGREAVELEGETLITNRAYRRWQNSTGRTSGQKTGRSFKRL